MMKIGRNDPCFCGSGKKYKNCCMQNTIATVSRPTVGNSNKAKIENALKIAASNVGAGNFRDATLICQQILKLEPNHDAALNLLGVLAYYSGNYEVAVSLLVKSISINPKAPDAQNNLGEIYRNLGQFTSAKLHFEQAIKLNPRYIEALINYGNVLQDLKLHQNAIEVYQRVLKMNPNQVAALSNLANAQQEVNSHSDAINSFNTLLNIDKDFDWGLGGLVYSKLHCCDWQNIQDNLAMLEKQIEQGHRVVKPFEMLPIIDNPILQLRCAKVFSEHLYPFRPSASSINSKDPLEKVRVAYISADFRQHAVSQLLVEVLEKHNKAKFEIIGVCLGGDDGSALRQRVVSVFDKFIEVNEQSDQQVANHLREMQVDVAIDLMGYTTNSRMGIFANRAAPVQIAYLGYAGTTGTEYIDYILADEVTIPVSEEAFYSEKVLRLPNSYFPRDTTLKSPTKRPNRSLEGLPDQAFVFCAFNNHYKITPQIFEVWMRLLNQVDNSVLWLTKATDLTKSNLRGTAAKHGVVGERLVFAERTELLEDHIARHEFADLFLDTAPYNAHTTASDALWGGLPVVTCTGHTFASRVAASLLTALRVPELITSSLAEYESLALELAKNPEALKKLKLKILKNKTTCSVFDTGLYVRNLESVLYGVVEYTKH